MGEGEGSVPCSGPHHATPAARPGGSRVCGGAWHTRRGAGWKRSLPARSRQGDLADGEGARESSGKGTQGARKGSAQGPEGAGEGRSSGAEEAGPRRGPGRAGARGGREEGAARDGSSPAR